MRLVLAARLSRKQKNGDQGIGIETQDQRGREWAEREGHQIVAVAADTKSGTVAPMDRENLREWVTAPEKLGQYDGILAYKTDRLSRGTQEDFTRIEHWASEHGKKLVIVDGPQYPARDDSDYWRWAAEKRTARVEWESIRERSMRAQGALRERGKLVGRPPWGYVSVGETYDHTMVPTAEGRRLVPEIFKRIIGGQSLETVAKWLKEETGRAWWAKSVAALVRNTTYIGRRQDAEGRTILRCEALVDAATFQRAAEALAGRPKRGPQNAENRAMLAGVLCCLRCGEGRSPMYRIQSGSDFYYRCAGRGAHRKGCGNMIRLSVVDAVVESWMLVWDEEVTVPKLVPGHDHSAELAEVRQDMRELAARDLSDEEYDAELGRLRAERDRLAALPAVADRWEDVPAGFTYADRWERQSGQERAAWLKSVGLTVWAAKDEDGGVRVEIRDRSGFAVRAAFV